MSGKSHLSDPTALSDAAAESLSKYQGKLRIPRVRGLPTSAAQILRDAGHGKRVRLAARGDHEEVVVYIKCIATEDISTLDGAIVNI